MMKQKKTQFTFPPTLSSCRAKTLCNIIRFFRDHLIFSAYIMCIHARYTHSNNWKTRKFLRDIVSQYEWTCADQLYSQTINVVSHSDRAIHLGIRIILNWLRQSSTVSCHIPRISPFHLPVYYLHITKWNIFQASSYGLA